MTEVSMNTHARLTPQQRVVGVCMYVCVWGSYGGGACDVVGV